MRFLPATTLAGAAGAQVAFATIGIARGFAKSENKREKPQSIARTTVNEKEFHPAVRTVLEMYGGKGVPIRQSCMRKDVVFEDPAAKVVGEPEVREAFRALCVMKPKTLAFEIVEERETSDSTIFEIDLWQRYNLGSYLPFEVYSRLSVEASRSDSAICRIEERWQNGSLLHVPPFGVVRRINGIASYNLTSIIIA
eukprot:jgi/Bigna1/67799/fgenesh1_pg.4_\